MAFTKFVQTPNYKNDQHTYKIELYIDDANPPTLRTMETTGDYKITRGNSSPEHKYEPIVTTYVDVQFIDKDGFLQSILESKQDHQLKCMILEDTVEIFSGFITANRLKRKFLNELETISIRVYDGFNYLKTFTDFSQLPQGKQSVSTLFNTLVNKLGLNRNLVIAIQTYPATTTSPIRPADFIGFDVSEYRTIKADATYYDLLVDLLKSLTCQLVSANGEFWIRQIPTYISGTLYFQRMYPNGSSDYSTSSWTFSSLNNHLAIDPKKFSINNIDKIIFKHSVKKDDANKFLQRKKKLDWVNPFFKEGVTGWTSTGGSLIVKENSVIVAPSWSLYQLSSIIKSGEEIEILISSTIVEWLQSGVELRNIPLFSISVCDLEANPVEIFYYDFNTNAWVSSQFIYLAGFLPEYVRYPGTSTITWVAGYYKLTVQKSISATIPTFTRGYGKIRVELLGGLANPYWNKFKNISAQHNYCIVRLKEDASEADNTYPSEERYVCKIIESLKSSTLETLFSDNDPYIPISFYDLTDSYIDVDGSTIFNKTESWTPGNLPLLQILSQSIIDSDANNLSGYDVTFNTYPSNKPSFINRVSANYEGLGSKIFLPVYEERFLLGNTCRMILLEHVRKSPTREFYSEYVFSDQ